MKDFELIYASQLRAKQRESRALVIDIRDRKEYESEHWPGAEYFSLHRWCNPKQWPSGPQYALWWYQSESYPEQYLPHVPGKRKAHSRLHVPDGWE